MDHREQHEPSGHYGRLLTMALLHFGGMYALMYAMVNAWQNVIPNTNQIYMAGLMTAPMIGMELILMRSMFPNRKLNAALITVTLVALFGFWICIRQQTGIGDKQFVKSMIPHHAGAILMCKESSINDPEIKELCQAIITSQQSEIARMKEILRRLNE